jgi:hypothetical protein
MAQHTYPQKWHRDKHPLDKTVFRSADSGHVQDQQSKSDQTGNDRVHPQIAPFICSMERPGQHKGRGHKG